MSATYNWSIRHGVINRYGITVPDTADDVRPDSFAYIALFGNDVTGNGSRVYPYRTVDKAKTTAANLIVGSGVYRNVPSPAFAAYADGDVVFDNSVLGQTVDLRLYGIKLISSYDSNLYNSKFSRFMVNYAAVRISDDFAYNFLSVRDSLTTFFSPSINLQNNGNNTFVDCNDFRITGSASFGFFNAGYFSIFYNCKISFIPGIPIIDYSLFYNCQFRIGTEEVYTPINDLSTFLTWLNTNSPNNPGYTHCAFADPQFNNYAIGDYTLTFESPAKNLSYLGTFVGAFSIAQSIRARASESAGGFEFSSTVNLTIADDSITLTNPALEGQIDTNVIVNLLGRELAGLPSYGFNADRNGQYIDSIRDLSNNTLAAGATLLIPVPYIVETGAITYNGAVYQPGERFTTTTGQATFSTTVAGVVREILEAPQRHTVLARFSEGGVAVTAGDALVNGYWYFVQHGSVTYNGATYQTGEVFQAVNTLAFSGSGTVITAMAAENYQHYELGTKPTSNNTGDLRTGVIIRGNGDPAYQRGGLGVSEFPINAKFIQLRYMISTTNMKP